jgi:acyl-CoA oxidase
LFGGTIVGLGTKKHSKYFDDIDSLKVMGCFCLTELGYGNNAIEMETTATWDNDKKVFIINTPTVNSQKYWITNGAYHANHSVVFAQVNVNGKQEGISAFIIRLRDENMKPSKGVTIDDMGAKQGLNGLDNARIILRNVEAGPDSLLDSIASINPEKNIFNCKITNRRQRFLAASNRLLSGRICIASMTISGIKTVLCTTNKYALTRMSNGPKGKSDFPIAQYQLFQNQIVPLTVRLIIYNLGLLHIRKVYCDYLLNPEKYSPADFNHLVRLICAIKPLVAWYACETGK